MLFWHIFHRKHYYGPNSEERITRTPTTFCNCKCSMRVGTKHCKLPINQNKLLWIDQFNAVPETGCLFPYIRHLQFNFSKNMWYQNGNRVHFSCSYLKEVKSIFWMNSAPWQKICIFMTRINITILVQFEHLLFREVANYCVVKKSWNDFEPFITFYLVFITWIDLWIARRGIFFLLQNHRKPINLVNVHHFL